MEISLEYSPAVGKLIFQSHLIFLQILNLTSWKVSIFSECLNDAVLIEIKMTWIP